MQSRNYEILSGNTLVAIWENETLSVINDTLLPLFLKKIHHADMWLETRAIDSHRANSRLLKKALRMGEKDDLSTVIQVNGAMITDNYWVRKIGEKLSYEDIRFSDDYFSTLALKGTYNSFNRAATDKHSKTPELTNIGSFEKCWKIYNGKWWMYKQATHNQAFSELFVYELGCALGMNMAVYERGNGCVKTLDFTDSATVNYEPASAFMGDNDDYSDVVKALKSLCPGAIPDYVRLIFMDTVCANPDRHTNNFGLLRDTKDGHLIGLAPNYDNNMALISNGYPAKPKPGDYLIVLFMDLLDEYPEFIQYMPEITEDMVRSVIQKIGMKVRTQAITDIVMGRYHLLKP